MMELIINGVVIPRLFIEKRLSAETIGVEVTSKDKIYRRNGYIDTFEVLDGEKEKFIRMHMTEDSDEPTHFYIDINTSTHTNFGMVFCAPIVDENGIQNVTAFQTPFSEELE